MTAKPTTSAYTGDAIVVDHITKKYGDFTAVDDVSFSVHQGEIFGLLGPNGAGKSTLIRMMTTLLPITAGRALINGFDVAKQPDNARQCMGVIPQALTSDIDLTVEENLNIYAKLYGVSAEDRRRNIDDLLETVDLTKWRGAQTKTLSGGMRRRLEIARGLVHSPKISPCFTANETSSTAVKSPYFLLIWSTTMASPLKGALASFSCGCAQLIARSA